MAEPEEKPYLDLVRDCLENGIKRMDRTGTGCFSCFGRSMRFSLADGKIPLLTTKTVPFRMVLSELLFFLRGQTDNKILKEKNIHIWDGNSTREFFDKIGIDREEDDLGPVYGFQWRHYGTEYKTCKDNYEGMGIDQLQQAIDTIKNTPESRRIVVVAWNPLQLSQMALPPCHTMFQFLVADGKLTCILYQRSGDIGLGIPFNIASYAIMTVIVAKLTGLEPYEFVHFVGDAHIYADHVKALEMQLEREPREFPTMRLAEKAYEKLEDFEEEDFELIGYNPHPKIVMKMSV